MVCCLQIAQAAGLPEELTSKAKQSRSEKKARKAITKLGEFTSSNADLHRPTVTSGNDDLNRNLFEVSL